MYAQFFSTKQACVLQGILYIPRRFTIIHTMKIRYWKMKKRNNSWCVIYFDVFVLWIFSLFFQLNYTGVVTKWCWGWFGRSGATGCGGMGGAVWSGWSSHSGMGRGGNIMYCGQKGDAQWVKYRRDESQNVTSWEYNVLLHTSPWVPGF